MYAVNGFFGGSSLPPFETSCYSSYYLRLVLPLETLSFLSFSCFFMILDFLATSSRLSTSISSYSCDSAIGSTEKSNGKIEHI